MKFPVSVLGVLSFLLPAAVAGASVPWDEISSTLETTAGLKVADVSPQLYLELCGAADPSMVEKVLLGLQQGDFTPFGEREANITSFGACVLADFLCGFEHCNPLGSSATLLERWNTLANPNYPVDSLALLNVSNPNYELPSKTISPQTAGDIVMIVEFAKKNNIELSVKNSGHSLQGASQKRNTLLLNMIQFPKYSKTGIVECEESSDTEPCKLALARSKKAYIRVGGGENFYQAYESVKMFNEGLDVYRYMLIGGSYPSVSPMGWTLQGGLAGSTAGRLYGFGVDQVLQLDMVLPAGVHVRFGPTEWEDSSATVYPRNTQISGLCHENPDEPNEDLWVWKECSDIDFEDLWFAVLGGGGGTYGIVTSMYLQLHDWVPIQSFDLGLNTLNETCGIPITFPQAQMSYDILDNSGGDVNFEALGRTYWAFLLDFFHDPNSIGISEEDSNACSCHIHAPDRSTGFCYGEGAVDVYANAWKQYIIANNQTMADAGMTYSNIQKAHDCIDIDTMINREFKDQVDYLGDPVLLGMYPFTSFTLTSSAHLGPDLISNNVLVPKKFVIENKETVVSMLHSMNTHTYFAFGGATYNAQDEDSVGLSTAHRSAAFMMLFIYDFPKSFFTDIFPQMYDTSTGDFPGFIGSNHIGAHLRGPLKSDWTKPCPIEWSGEERNKNCISAQESIYGSKRLARLEAIKETIDPTYMFNCNGCVGNNRPKESTQPHEPENASASIGLSVSLCTIGLVALGAALV